MSRDRRPPWHSDYASDVTRITECPLWNQFPFWNCVLTRDNGRD